LIQHFPGLRLLDIQRDAALAAIEPDEMAADPIDVVVVRACEITLARTLDLDDVSAEICQMPAA
jgi:hypothetical protein